jgi:DNA modification methylase
MDKVYHADALTLLAALPTASIDACITDPMYGVSQNQKPRAFYDWGHDPAGGDPDKWWTMHGPIYKECLRVLRPGGALAWAMGCKFRDRFAGWFGAHRIWSFTRYRHRGMNCFGHIWIVQTREQGPIRFPDKDSLIIMNTCPTILKRHPCPKAVPEMSFLVDALTTPGQTVLDPFCGTGTTLIAAGLLGRRYLGCDISETYCKVAMKRLTNLNLLK